MPRRAYSSLLDANSRAFAKTGEDLACGRLSDAAAGAMVAEVYQFHRRLDANDAHRRAAMVSLGKHSKLFRHGNDAKERAHAVEELTIMLLRSKTHTGRRLIAFPANICKCIAETAIDELAIDICPTCSGAGEIPDHSLKLEGRQPMTPCTTCHGSLRRSYSDDERIKKLACAWIGVFPEQPLADPAAVSVVAASLRKHPRLGPMLDAVTYAKRELLAAERIAIEETARMVERWRVEE